MKYNTFFLCIVAVFIFSSRAKGGTIFWVSEGIRANSMFSVYGYGLNGNLKLRLKETGDVLNPVQVDSFGRFATFIMPNARNGVYTLQLSQNGGKSWKPANSLRAITINKADLRWTSDLRVYRGLKAKVFGRNLNAAEFNGIANTQLRFVATTGLQVINARVLDCTPFCIDYEAPAELLPGKTYYIDVRTNANGAGNQWVRMRNYPEYASTRITVVPAPTHPLALALGVGWAVDFNWNYTKSITDYGVPEKSSVSVDCSSGDWTGIIKKAMQDLHNQGGGVLNFPAGTYCFTELLMPSGVIINGEGNDKTVLKNIHGGCADAIIGFDTSGYIGKLGIANCKIIRSHDTNPWFTIKWGHYNLSAIPKGSHLFLYNNYIDMTEDRTDWFGASSNGFHCIDLEAKEKVLFKNNIHIDQSPGVQKVQQDYQIVGNKFEYCNSAHEIIGSNRFIFCDNEITSKHFPPDSIQYHCQTTDTIAIRFNGPKGLYLSLYPNSPVGNWGTYVANNHSHRMIANIGANGAFLTTDGSLTKFQGMSTSATRNTVDVKKTLHGEKMDTLPWNLDYQVKIIRGKGLGQLRRLTGYSDLGNGNYRLTVSPAWDVIPNNESEICVGQYYANMVIEKNTIDSSNTAVYLYHAAYDNVVADNISRGGGGFTVLGQSYINHPTPIDKDRSRFDIYNHYDQSAAFAVFKRDTVYEAGFDASLNKTNTGFALVTWDYYNFYNNSEGVNKKAAWGPLLYGTEIRDCVVDRINSIDTLIDTGLYWYYFDAGVSIGNSHLSVENGENILATLIENITIKNAPLGILAFGSANNEEDVIGCHTIRYLTIRDFKTEKVRKKYAEAGGCNTDNKVCILGQPDALLYKPQVGHQ